MDKSGFIAENRIVAVPTGGGGDCISIVGRIKTIFRKQEFAADTPESAAAAESIPNADSGYGKKLVIGKEEKANLAESLTPREKDTFLLLMEGFTLKETARKLNIGYSTANTYQTAIYRKLHVNSRAELIINYMEVAAMERNSP